MASAAQIAANRRNARKSTGPRTAEGKAVVSQNAIRHGLTARQDVIGAEDQAAFDRHRDRIFAELAPVGCVESMLAERAAGLLWRLRRSGSIQNQAFDSLIEEMAANPLARLTRSLRAPTAEMTAGQSDTDDADLTLGRVAVKDFARNRVLDRLLMYERRIENSLYRTLVELHRLRVIRHFGSPQRDGGTESVAAETVLQNKPNSPWVANALTY